MHFDEFLNSYFFCCIFLIASTTDNWKGLPQRGSIEQILLDVLKKTYLIYKNIVS